MTVVGVVGDTKLYGLENPSRFEVYVPYRQNEQRHARRRSQLGGSSESDWHDSWSSGHTGQGSAGIQYRHDAKDGDQRGFGSPLDAIAVKRVQRLRAAARGHGNLRSDCVQHRPPHA